MNLFKGGVAAVLLFSVIAPWAQAGPSVVAPARVRALVEQLDDDRFLMRQDADRELRQIGVAALPLLQKEAEGALPLEARQRLSAIIADLSTIHWRCDLDTALGIARAAKKPLLVVCTPGLPAVPSSVASAALQQRTFNNLELITFLNAHFVMVWHDPTPGELHAQTPRPSSATISAEQVRDCKEGTGGGTPHTFFCAPDGTVVRHFVGFYGPSSFLKAAAEIRARLEAPSTAAATFTRATPVAASLAHGRLLALQVEADGSHSHKHAPERRDQRQLVVTPDPAVGQAVLDRVIEIERQMRLMIRIGC